MPSRRVKPCLKRFDQALSVRIGFCDDHEHTDPPYPLRLLRARRQRPRHRTAEQRDERAAPHSITSSAVICMINGTVRPSALAVFRLMKNQHGSSCPIAWGFGSRPGPDLAREYFFPVDRGPGDARCTATRGGTAKSGRGGRRGKVKSRKQAIAIALSKARKKGKRAPKKKK
jgi:hypothetical protein